MKSIQLILILFSSFGALAQVDFEKGYFIDETGTRVDCLIKNLGWNNNPTSFDYKESESGEVLSRTIIDTKEFAIGDEVKFEKYTVQVDLSSDVVDELTKYKKPDFSEKTVFLRKLIEGNFNLYDYVEGNVHRFFVSNDETDPVQLIYKRYRPDYNAVGVNTKFRGQLSYLFSCDDAKISTERLNYGRSVISQYVKKVYDCREETYKEYKKANTFSFNAKLKLGYRIASHKIDSKRASQEFTEEFDPSAGITFGIEGEYVFPFWQNRLSLPLNLTYHASSFSKENTELWPLDHTFTLDYSSLEIMPGIRYNHYLNDDTSLGLSLNMVLDVILSETNRLEYFDLGTLVVREDPFFETNSVSNFVIVGSIKHKKYYAEIGYGTNRNLSNFSTNWNSKYSHLSFMIGYTLFSSN